MLVLRELRGRKEIAHDKEEKQVKGLGVRVIHQSFTSWRRTEWSEACYEVNLEQYVSVLHKYHASRHFNTQNELLTYTGNKPVV
jgi:hypothetical protein